MGAGAIRQPDGLTGVVAALPAEARTARRLERAGWQVTVAGMGAERARAACKALLDNGVKRLLVWGTAGGLQSDLRPGDLIAPREVQDTDGGRFPISQAWQAQLLTGAAFNVRVSTEPLVSVHQSVPDRQAKQALAQQTGAVAVDMETAAVARLAVEHGVPFAVLRTIVDPLEQALPQAVLQTEPGRFFASRIALRLAVHPGDLPALVALGLNMRAAQRSLATTARVLEEAAGQTPVN